METKASAPPRVNVRAAVAADAALLADLGARSFREAFEEFNRPADMAAFLEETYGFRRQTAELANPLLSYFVGELDGTSLGFAMLRDGTVDPCVTGPRPLELARLYVLRGAIGTGLGSALMSACLTEARRRRHETLWLGVWEHNERAKSFYRRWDFVDVGSHIFKVGSDPQVDRVLACPL